MVQAFKGKAAVFPVSVKAIVPCGDRFLLLRSPKGLWDIPGGKLDPGETALECLARECVEEMGFTPTPLRMVDTWTRPREKKPDVFVLFYLCAGIETTDVVRLGVEHEDFDLFAPAEIAGLPMHEGYREVLLRLAAAPIKPEALTSD